MDLELVQCDVSTAFLNGTLDEGEEIFMEQPSGFYEKNPKEYVARLIRSLYGLRSAPKVWYRLLHKVLLSLGFARCEKEFCLYVKRGGRDGRDLYIICVYADDLSIAGKEMSEINKIKEQLFSRFKMKDLGDMKYILKMEVIRDRKKKFNNNMTYDMWIKISKAFNQKKDGLNIFP